MSKARDIADLDFNSPDIDGGNIDGAVIGATTAAAATVSTFTVGDSLFLQPDGNNDLLKSTGGVLYLKANEYSFQNNSGVEWLSFDSSGNADFSGNATVSKSSGNATIASTATANNTRAIVQTTAKTSGAVDVQGVIGSYGDASKVDIGTLSNHTLSILTNNTVAANFDTSQNVTFKGNVTIDHDDSDPYLIIDGSTGSRDSGVKINSGNGERQALRQDNGNNLYIGNNALLINGSGNVSTTGTITTTGGRIFVGDGSHVMALGTWDGSSHRIEGDANRPIHITSYYNQINMGTSGNVRVKIENNVNSTGDGGMSVTSGNRLGFDESGTRSWTLKAASGNLQVNSGDGNGSFYIGMGTHLNGSLIRNVTSTGLVEQITAWGHTFYFSLDWSSQARTLTLFTNASYFQAKVTAAFQQSNGGTDNNRWVEGMWTNNHTTHLWKQISSTGFTGATETFTASVGPNASNSGKLEIVRPYQANASGTFRVKVEVVGYSSAGLTYSIT